MFPSNSLRTYCLLMVFLKTVQTATLNTNFDSNSIKNENEGNFGNFLDKILSNYYDNYVTKSTNLNKLKYNVIVNNKSDEDTFTPASKTSIYDQMQGDQPITNYNFTKITNFTAMSSVQNETDILRAIRNRTKDSWMQFIKENILRQVGRSNMTSFPSSQVDDSDNLRKSLNLTDVTDFLNRTQLNHDIIERVRSYHPSCETPPGIDLDFWKDENIMNLYFNVSSIQNGGDDKTTTNIATAILRLYRIPQQHEQLEANTSAKVSVGGTTKNDCNSTNTNDEERLLRVSIYWYTKTSKKRRIKRRLSDSKVVSEQAPWVELSVKPATRTWSKGRNLGLAVLVEDQEENRLRADKYFKGASCMVGASTPKPIPTIIIDAARKNSEFNRFNSLLGGNATMAESPNRPMLPSIDICTLELPENSSMLNFKNFNYLNSNACNLRKINEYNERLIAKEKFERLAMLPNLFAKPPIHIRHQRQYFNNRMNGGGGNIDVRSGIINKQIVLTKDEILRNFTSSLRR